MSNDMISVPRELAEKLEQALKIFTGHDSYPNLRHHYGNEWWEPVDQMRDELRALLTQPTTCTKDGGQREPVDVPYAEGIAEQLERTDWTPEEALRWYAEGKHFDVVDARTRIIDTGSVASNALKHLSLDYLEMKGDAELAELRTQAPVVLPERILGQMHDDPIAEAQQYGWNAYDDELKRLNPTL